jgi:hypothetical protein
VDFDKNGVPIVRRVSLSIWKDEESPLAELADSDPEGKFNERFDMVDEFLVGAGGPDNGPCAALL